MRWLDRAQAQGRYTDVPRPFILKPDQAVRMLLTQREGSGTGESRHIEQQITALALALSEPQSRMGIAQRVDAAPVQVARAVGEQAHALGEGGASQRERDAGTFCLKA